MEPTVREMSNFEARIKSIWRRWFWPLCILLSLRFWKEPLREYPQTWYYMPRKGVPWGWMRILIQAICRHEVSKTEWGYGGGEFVDRNCRWCDKVIKEPITATRFSQPMFRELRPDLPNSQYHVSNQEPPHER